MFFHYQRTLLGAPGIATRSKKLLGAPGLTTRNKDATRKFVRQNKQVDSWKTFALTNNHELLIANRCKNVFSLDARAVVGSCQILLYVAFVGPQIHGDLSFSYLILYRHFAEIR